MVSEKGRFSGTSYKAANWISVGETKGYAKRKKLYAKHGIIKNVYLYPVRKDSVRLLNSIYLYGRKIRY